MNNTFLSDFLMITNFKTILFFLFLIGVFFVIRRFERNKASFSKRMIIATISGLILGGIVQVVAGFPNNPDEISWVKETASWYGLIGNGFMDLLKMLVVPLVFISIIKVIIDMKNGENLGKLTFRTIAVLLLTTTIASIIGIIVGNLFKLGVGLEVVKATSEMKEVTSIIDTIRSLLPSNPIKAMAEGNVVAVVIFAAFIGIAIKRLSESNIEKIDTVEDFVEGAYKITVSIAMTVIRFMPYAVVPLLANTIASRGLSAIIGVINFIIALYISVILMFIVHLIIVAINGLNPITYIKNVMEPLILAFTSRSSLGTLPVTIETLTEKVGLDNGVASFVGSIGSNAGMNGCAAIYPALMAITIANISGTPMNFSFYVMLVIIIVIGSIGIAGIPGTATVSVSVTISGMGMGSYFPLVGGILAIDPILDMARTMLNVNGTMVTAIAVGNSFNAIDKKIFYGENNNHKNN